MKRNIVFAALLLAGTAFAADVRAAAPGFEFTRQRLFPGFDGKLCKMQPSVASDGKRALLTYQKLLLTGSDVFYGQYMCKSADGGRTWSEPQEIKLFEDTREDGFRVARYAALGYSAKNRRWFGLGMTNLFKDDKEPFQKRVGERAWADPLFAAADPDLGTYVSCKVLKFPFEYDGCYPFGQFLEEDDGSLLIPFYYVPRDAKTSSPHRVVVVRYRFSGDTLEPVEAGEPLYDASLARGLCEPSLAKLGGTYYLTLRSDETGFVASSGDGLRFGTPVPWRWQDGTSVGNRNTQQHWLRFKDALYLAYTRETAQNGHVFRNRAPVWSARFDPKTMGLVRETEFPLVPELGARLGNFCVADVDGDAWLVTAEWMQPVGCERYGSDNSIWLVKARGANLSDKAGPANPAFDACTFHGKTDKANPAAYRAGEPIVFTLWFEGVGELPKGKSFFVAWERTGDDGRKETGRAPFDPKGTVTVKTSMDRPGFVRLLAHVQDADGANVRRSGRTPGDMWGDEERTVFFDGGAGVEPEKLRPGVEEPDDFDAFWARQRARLAAVPVKAVRRELPGAADAKARVYEVRVDCAGPRPVTGYLTMPKAPGRYRAYVSYHGYGTGYPEAPKDGPADRITFNVNAHGYELGRDKAYYDAFFDGIRTKDYAYAFSPVQNDTPEGAYFCGMALRVMRSLEYVKTLPEWDGRNLTAQGGSQGGLQTLWAAGLDKDVSRVFCGITWCCDLGGFKAGRLQAPWHIPWTDALRYFDATFHARRVKCRLSIERAGLGDYTCPPSGLAVLFNELKGEKSIKWVQGSRHGFVPAGENQEFEIRTY